MTSEWFIVILKIFNIEEYGTVIGTSVSAHV
jgi:hypothetical protein